MPANPERGEVSLEVVRNGETTEYVLMLSMNASAALEARRGKAFGELLEDVERGHLTTIRDLLFMLLQKYHREQFKTPESVGDLVDEVGLAKMGDVFALVMGRNKAEGATNPQKALPTTGAAPSSTRAE